MMKLVLAVTAAFVAATGAQAADVQFDTGKAAINAMTGCYLIDYSYAETESLKPGYAIDGRVYDVNRRQSVKEWIYAEELTPTRTRVQHILFATDLAGNLVQGSELKHQAEDWEYNAPFLYDFVGPAHWVVKNLSAQQGQWTRRVTNLDDGLRYQCSAAWNVSTAYPEWTCSNYAPIPGRETRDMGRKDYNTLQRTTRIVHYGNSWLERQDNVKTIHSANGGRTPLAREVGKNWYVRLPDSECSVMHSFVSERAAFWSLLRQTWDEVLVGDRDYVERVPQGAPPRFAQMMTIEDNAKAVDLKDARERANVKSQILKVISDYRAN